ncbi:hypothetical protein MLD63_11745 [Paracoccus sp. TK19116]|uniref:Transglycosylase SLT domain-containing protein n=1 Tax=Paracoccus albicereus TaxID=2922394 RepID=A0ABT1MSE1_9RHOB|nr:hypothetical protein [Paracoccus albicereus]MCQ0971096.1 hypothetical protein [Paracoccus albicereus]
MLVHRHSALIAGFVAVVLALFVGPVRASTANPAEVCEWAAQQAAAESGVPADILGALTLTETGRRLDGVVRPWAWSVNAEGAGSWFDNPSEALAFAQDRIAQGRRNMDVGCFQLNVRWHGENFRDVTQMFDPLENARYAARFVSDLYRETGDWRKAAGAFHSRTPHFANKYLTRFDELRSVFRERGFGGMTGAPETYNSFASASGTDPVDRTEVSSELDDPLARLVADLRIAQGLPAEALSQPRRVRKPVQMMGAALGTPVTGHAGSLAVIGGAGQPLFGDPVQVAVAPLLR